MSGQQHAPAALYPRERPGTHFLEAGWAPGPVWTGGKSRPRRDSIPDRPARSSVAVPTELPGPHYYTCKNSKSGHHLSFYSAQEGTVEEMWDSRSCLGGRLPLSQRWPSLYAWTTQVSALIRTNVLRERFEI